MIRRAMTFPWGRTLEPLVAILCTWRYQSASVKRDRRLDLLRGVCLVTMMVDHISGDSLLTPLTGNNHFVVSAAEGFVFISGVVFGSVSYERIRNSGLQAAIGKALHRAAFLYGATTFLTLALVGLLEFTRYPLWIDRNVPLGVDRPFDAVVGALTVHFTYQGTEILAMYIFFFLASPLALALLKSGRTSFLLGGSFGLWLAYQVWPSVFVVPWSAVNAGNFPFAAWQLVFTAGTTIGYHRAGLTRALSRLPITTAFIGIAILFGLLVEVNSLAERSLLGEITPDSPLFEFLFHKVNLAPGRLAAFGIVTAFFYLALSIAWRPFAATIGRIFIPLGENALFAYGFHLFILGLAPIVVPWGPPDNPWIHEINTARQLVVIVPVIAGVAALSLFRRLAMRPVLRSSSPGRRSIRTSRDGKTRASSALT